ncbi:helix-turn-helix domain-containing protein [Aquimarina sp. 2201CG5-10]|uniref:helix-turn-helix domain-containing protein n=1 Tax=Aquimarina callyspongiae TaxID=3098150 RepID=UPI002AB53CB4|nr:helix-turn-helix domain-containing protein [Aquimarina sp. 2201CG5-10]MDY8137232.1 helix-turn-helix domain-containing protein [Aquimarina sp. 2201CG5-10]
MKRILFLVLILSCKVLAQDRVTDFKIPDSLEGKRYLQLYELFFENYKKEPDKAYVYAKTYIEKGRQEKKDFFTTRGFFLISHLYEGKERYLVYMDSIIQLSKESKNQLFLADGYLLKGDYYLTKGMFKKALNNYNAAKEIALQKSNLRILYSCNRSVGQLKSWIGEHRGALKSFQKCYEYASKKDLKDQVKNILFLAREYNYLNVLDSASYFNKRGIQKSLNNKDEQLYHSFVLNSAITNYHEKKYKQGIDSITKAFSYFQDNNRTSELTLSYYYLGKIYSEIDLKDQSIHYLIKMDSMIQIEKNILPDMIEGFKILMNHFEEEKSFDQRLLYSKKLSQTDSLYNSVYTDSIKKVIKEYDIPLIVFKDDIRISNLKDDGFSWRITIVVLTLFLIIFISATIFLYKDRARYQKSFRAIVSHTNQLSDPESMLKEENEKKLNDLNISTNVIERVLKGMNDFENKERYLSKKYSLNVLAKELDTNSTYLSKIINVYKGKNFSNYLHDLRIGYAIERLKDDRQFRLYSIKGISEEVGFKNSESFSKAFHKKTGIYPSSFINKLKHI